MTETVSSLSVLLHGETIGTLTHLGHDKTTFSFADSYVNNPSRPILSLSFLDVSGEVMIRPKVTQTKLLPFFSNLLPENALRDYLASRAGVNPVREFFLLRALGSDLPGAIRVEPSDGQVLPSADGKSEGDQDGQRPMRFSLAGVQLKFSAVQRARCGLTIPATGEGGSWIVKLPSQRFDALPENEYAMMELARKIGIDVPETRLMPIDQIQGIPQTLQNMGSPLKRGEHAFVIRRFDRGVGQHEGHPIHIEDFAQVFGVYPNDKYRKASMRNIAQVLKQEASQDDQIEFIRRLVFSALIGNADMHLKNWSLIYRDRHRASLSPAYDFVSTIAYLPDDSAALTVSRSKKFSDFTLDELQHLAVKAKLAQDLVIDTAKQTVQAFDEIWSQEKAHLPLTSSMVEAIDQHRARVPLS
ncbi:MAG TPA: HipA domain-containing protein [Orrella sp.]